MDDKALLAALKQRDAAALAAVFERYSPQVYRLAVNLPSADQRTPVVKTPHPKRVCGASCRTFAAVMGISGVTQYVPPSPSAVQPTISL